MFNLDHPRDPNGSQVLNHTFTQHTATPAVQDGRVVARYPKTHKIDVELAGLRTNKGQPVVIRGIKVGTDYAGNGYGDHTLPLVGQQVELSFSQGIGTSPHHIKVIRRHYTQGFKPPYHPMLDEDDGGYFRQMPHGSYVSWHHAEGTLQYNAKPHLIEGDGVKERATGISKSATEARIEASGQAVEKAVALTDEIANLAKRAAAETKRLGGLLKVQAFIGG